MTGRIVRFSLSCVIVITVGFVLLAISSGTIYGTFRWFIAGVFSSLPHFVEFLNRLLPLLLTGAAVLVVFRTGVFNIGAEGQMLMGGITATFIALHFPEIPLLHLCITLLMAALMGGLWGVVPGFIKVVSGVSEVITSIIMNFAGLYVSLYILNHHIKDPEAGYLVSYTLSETARLPQISGLNSGIFVAVGLVLILYFFLYRTPAGFNMRIVGYNRHFARYVGIDVERTEISAQLISGILAGLAGGVEVCGLYGKYLWHYFTGLGFEGIPVALMSGLEPLMLPVSAAFFSYMKTGTYLMGRMSAVTPEVGMIVNGLMVIILASYGFLGFLRMRETSSRRMK